MAEIEVNKTNRPTVGRNVHFFSRPGAKPLPAIVTEASDESLNVNLQVIHNSDAGLQFIHTVPHKDDVKGNVSYWAWPELS